jgi:hypothetical protein
MVKAEKTHHKRRKRKEEKGRQTRLKDELSDGALGYHERFHYHGVLLAISKVQQASTSAHFRHRQVVKC